MKAPKPVRVATEIVEDCGLTGDAGNVLELVNDIADELRGAHAEGFRKALIRIKSTIEANPGLTLGVLLDELERLIGDAEEDI